MFSGFIIKDQLQIEKDIKVKLQTSHSPYNDLSTP